MMKKPDAFTKERQAKIPQIEGGLDPLVILSLISKNWYFFVIALMIAFYIARFYISHTMPVYRVSTTLLINEADQTSNGNNDQILKGFGLPGGMSNMENQIMMLYSRTLTERTLSELPFEIEYYYKTARNQIPVYPDIPVRILPDNDIPLPVNTEFSVTFMGNNLFNLTSESEYFPLNKQASFGETIEIQGGSFRIECKNEEWFTTNIDKKLYFVIRTRSNLINYFNSRLEVELLSKGGSVVKISIAGTNYLRDVDFLNKLTEVFQSISLDKKNTEALRRIQFIDDQLVGISDSLSLTENKLQEFRSTHRVMDLSAQGQSIIEQITVLENERVRLNLEANYYDYLADYLAKDAVGEIPIVPVTMGITDPGLTRIVDELSNLQGQLSARGAGELNPLQRNLEQRARAAKETLRETLNGLKRANSIARSDNQQQINKVNSQASALPSTERQLLGIERKFKLNDDLYTFLLQTRAEQQMQKASNIADSEVIDPAEEQYASLISPNSSRIYFVAVFAGCGIPFIILFLVFLFDKRLKDEDIRRMTDLPIIGNIPFSVEKTNTIVFDNPNSSIAEAFRLLRSRMQFLTKDATAPVILITSPMPEDGKTYISINLASVYSMLGKKTVLVGFDLRKPKIFQDFMLNNEKGVSTWLIGKDKFQDIIQETSFENLSVISAGPVPPNPSELTALEKTEELIKLLKEKYDFIVIDSSPIGIVSDTFYLASLSDACLLVVSPGKTLRDIFGITLNEIDSSGTKGISIIMNRIRLKNKHYGYSEKYGYTNGKEKPKKRLFRRKIITLNT